MIFINSDTQFITVGAAPAGLWSYAHNGGAGIIPPHLLIVQNVGTVHAILGTSTGARGFDLAPGKEFRMNVPVGDELHAFDPTGTGAQLHVMAIVG